MRLFRLRGRVLASTQRDCVSVRAWSRGERLPAVLLGAGIVLLTVRLIAPSLLDEPTTALLLFGGPPAVVLLLAGARGRHAAVGIAALLPAAWALLLWEPTDGAAGWLTAVAGAGLLWLVGAYTGGTRLGAAALGVSLALACGALAWPQRPPRAGDPRMVLVGIDGATWERIDPLVAQGRLPHFARLLTQGLRARLRSLPSLYSPQIWSTIATGCLPEAHGIQDFGNQQQDYLVGRVWDEMRVSGRPCGTCGWYFTWPPQPGLGRRDFVVPSTLAHGDTTWPPQYGFLWRLWARESGGRVAESLVGDGLAAFRHGARLSTLRRAASLLIGSRWRRPDPLADAWRERALSAALVGDVFVELVRTRRPEFATVLFNTLDGTSHRFWKYMDPKGFPDVSAEEHRRYGGAIDALYCEMDRDLGHLLAVLPANGNLLVVSDHGFRAGRDRTAAGVWRVGVEQLLRILGADADLFGTTVDERVYLRVRTPSSTARQSMLAGVATRLRQARLAGEQFPFFIADWENGLLRLQIAPRDAVPENARIVLGADVEVPLAAVVELRPEALFSGVHSADGIFLLAGPATRAWTSAAADSLHVLDIAPTLAVLLELPPSPLWSGRSAIAPPAAYSATTAPWPPPVASTAESATPVDEALQRKLRALGYLH